MTRPFDELPPGQDALAQMRDQLRAGGTLISVEPLLRQCLDRVQEYVGPLLDAGYRVDVQLWRGSDGLHHCEIVAHDPAVRS